MITAIEVTFAVPVNITSDQERRIADVVNEIARANTPKGHVHWLSSTGCKPVYSQADQRLLGKAVDPSAPESGEPSFDSSVLSFETFCREDYR